MTKVSRALTGAFFFAQASASPAEGDNFVLIPSRDIASMEPSDIESSAHVDHGLALWELGIGIGGAVAPDYPGSDQSRVVVIPFPFGFYRGRIIQSDPKGARARLLTGKDFDMSISGDGAYPLKSSDDIARSGMEDLGWMLQLGPKVRIDLKDWADGSRLRIGASYRAAVSTNDFSSLTSRGFVLEPEIVYQKPDAFGDRFDLFVSLSSTIATANYMDYLYGVRPGDATATRRSFATRAGYLETDLQAGLSYRTVDGRHQFILSGDAGSLNGGINSESPLIRSKLDLSVGIAWIWTLFASEQRAEITD
jgi:outer membrane protein